MNTNTTIALDVLNNLSPEEREVALKILAEYSQQGESELLNDIKYADFDEIPVDIVTFMHNPEYLGKGLYDGEGRFTVFPYWEEKLKDIFPDNLTTKYNTIIFTGSIGIGKSTIAVIILLYLLYRLLCMKDPYQYYGMQPIDKITISLMNITIKNAQGVALDKMNQLILYSPWFLRHGEMSGTTNLMYKPEKHIEVIVGSSNNQVIGRALFGNFSDEVNFGITNDVEKLKKKYKTLVSQIDARMKSRFLRGTYLPTVNIIASSKNSDQAFLDDYIKTKKENESKNTLIVDEPQWVVDDRKNSPNKFYVAIGNKFLANELLPLNVTPAELEVWRNKGYSILEVPEGYYDNFAENIDGALCDIAGISTASAIKYISGQRLMQAKTDTYQNPFTRDVIEVGNSPDDHLQYANFFDMSKVSPEDLARPLFIHLDLSTGGSGKGDKSGIAGTWITGKQISINSHALPSGVQIQENGLVKLDENAEDSSRDLTYKLAFSVSVKAPKGFQISFQKTRNFIRWLRDQGFNIKGVSADTYQSAGTLQDLKADGFETKILSVDRITQISGRDSSKICLPYYYLRTAIYDRRVLIYQKCDLLTEELVNLERQSDGHINHPDNGTHGSKDQADAFCGSLFLASQYADHYTFDYAEQLQASLDSNIVSDDYRKQQLIMDLENELKQLWLDNQTTDSSGFTRQEREDYQFYQDIADGIIII